MLPARNVVLSCVRNQAEEAVGSKLAGSIPPCFLPQFLFWLPSIDCDLGCINQMNPFLPTLLWGSVL